MLHPLLNPRHKTMVRGGVFLVVSLVLTLRLSGYPHFHPCAWIVLPLLLTLAGSADTARCMRRRWDWYHGGVILMLYADLMLLAIEGSILLYTLYLDL